MFCRHLPHGAAVVAVLLGFHAAAVAGDERPASKKTSGVRAQSPSKNSLTAESMPALHKLIRLQPGEFKWDAIPWYASIWHARKAAAAEDKPIFVFGTGGAGFNDPLGNC
jgi:hypothetical protein